MSYSDSRAFAVPSSQHHSVGNHQNGIIVSSQLTKIGGHKLGNL